MSPCCSAVTKELSPSNATQNWVVCVEVNGGARSSTRVDSPLLLREMLAKKASCKKERSESFKAAFAQRRTDALEAAGLTINMLSFLDHVHFIYGAFHQLSEILLLYLPPSLSIFPCFFRSHPILPNAFFLCLEFKCSSWHFKSFGDFSRSCICPFQHKYAYYIKIKGAVCV